MVESDCSCSKAEMRRRTSYHKGGRRHRSMKRTLRKVRSFLQVGRRVNFQGDTPWDQSTDWFEVRRSKFELIACRQRRQQGILNKCYSEIESIVKKREKTKEFVGKKELRRRRLFFYRDWGSELWGNKRANCNSLKGT